MLYCLQNEDEVEGGCDLWSSKCLDDQGGHFPPWDSWPLLEAIHVGVCNGHPLIWIETEKSLEPQVLGNPNMKSQDLESTFSFCKMVHLWHTQPLGFFHFALLGSKHLCSCAPYGMGFWKQAEVNPFCLFVSKLGTVTFKISNVYCLR